MGPPQSSRPRSVASAPRPPSAAAQRSSQILPPNDLGDGQPVIQRFNPGSKLASAETNIKVVIRCRRRSEREIQDNSPIIVNSNGAKSNEVTIETAASTSTLGVVTLPPTRTYPFDVVFGPEADQSLVYQEVVAPMLEEVLQGYNCTLFAYGQTGTGKT
jgi:kinesin family protein 11